MRVSFLCSLIIVSCFILLLGSSCSADRTASEVLVVYNSGSPISTAVSNDYKLARHVKNVVAIVCPDSAVSTDNETISYADYNREIAAPISKYLAKHKKINFIVLTKGVPLRVNGSPTGDGAPGPLQASVDSCLASIDYATLPGATKASMAGSGTVGTAWINRYYYSDQRFTHAKFGGYIVTRLDGYTESDAEGLVHQAIAAEHSPKTGDILFDIEPDFGLGDKFTSPPTQAATVLANEAAWSTFNADMLRASDILEATGVPHITVITTLFVGYASNLLGYFSWGSNDDHFSQDAYESLQFAPGSICDTAVSTSGRTFLPTIGGQTLIADLIAHGMTCCQGYIDEPILDGISSPTIVLSHYLSGYTAAESFYAGTRYLGWEGVCVCDPLCSPYKGSKVVTPTMAAQFTTSSPGVNTEQCSESGLDLCSISDGNYASYKSANFTNENQLITRIASGASGGVIELRLNSVTGPLVGQCQVPATGDWQKWATVTCPLTKKVKGRHNLFLVFQGGAGNLFNIQWFALRNNCF
jgi:uncharacterized protein (TIGR03790 family)